MRCVVLTLVAMLWRVHGEAKSTSTPMAGISCVMQPNKQNWVNVGFIV